MNLIFNMPSNLSEMVPVIGMEDTVYAHLL